MDVLAAALFLQSAIITMPYRSTLDLLNRYIAYTSSPIVYLWYIWLYVGQANDVCIVSHHFIHTTVTHKCGATCLFYLTFHLKFVLEERHVKT